MEEFLEVIQAYSDHEAGNLLGLSHTAIYKYRKGDWKRIYKATRRKIEAFLSGLGEAGPSDPPNDVLREAVAYFRHGLRVLESRVLLEAPTGPGDLQAPNDPILVDDRVDDRLRAQAAATAKLPDPDVSPIQSAPGWHDEDYESVRRYESEDVRLAAGTGTFADQEPVPSEVKFLKSWLRDHHLRAKDLFLANVLGDSMETTIYDGDSALVDETHRSPRSGKIYALRTGDGLLVKRLRKRDHRWWADSDNEEHEPQPLDDRARIMGRVVWWAHTD